jgi:predicted AlkP superfamily phosphohydrolase/phosphomutase
MARVLIIGLDGATFDLITPWANKGELPNIAGLMAEGAHGPLRSTFPPMTFPAWNSFMTGKNPGKHGIYDFTERVPGTYGIQFINARWRQAETMWGILSRAGRRVCVLSVPVTYPPEEVNGVMISGFDAPGVGARADLSSMHPPGIYAELNEKVGRYIIASNVVNEIDGNMPEKALDVILNTLERKAATARYLLEKEPWDCFMILFGESDLVSHHFWRFHDRGSPYHEPSSARCEGAILEVYRALDAAVGDLKRIAGKDTTVMLMSDHGFGGSSDKAVFLNRWLETEGLLGFREEGGSGIIMSGVNGILTRVKNTGLKVLPSGVKREIFRKRTAIVNRMESTLRFSRIDWGKTRAYSEETPYYPNIWLNLSGREPMGTVENGGEYEDLRRHIAERLLKWTDPESGERVVKDVYMRDDLYRGGHVSKSPDLVIDWNLADGYAYVSRKSTRAEALPLRRLGRDEIRRAKFQNKSGSHRDFGIFVMNGGPVKRRHAVAGAEIIDLAPTVLYLLGEEIPGDMDGKVLESVFNDDYLESHPVRRAGGAASGDGRGKGEPGSYSTEEERIISERLRGMGYM